MPPGPCVPFPGAGGTFPPARRPAARSPSEAAVATRTPSGASARTIGIVGIKCQEVRRGARPHPALPALARRPSSGLRPPSPASGRRVMHETTPLPCAAWERVPRGEARAQRGAATGHARHLLPQAGEGSSDIPSPMRSVERQRGWRRPALSRRPSSGLRPPSPAGGRRMMRPDQVMASTRLGPPVPPRTLGAPTMRVAPLAGMAPRLATHSRPQRPVGSQP